MNKKTYLNICDSCCDKIGSVKEVFKTGGCTCDLCAFTFACIIEKDTVSRIRIDWIKDWEMLQEIIRSGFE